LTEEAARRRRSASFDERWRRAKAFRRLNRRTFLQAIFPSSAEFSVLMRFHLAMHHEMLITLFGNIFDFLVFLFVHLGIRGGEGRINVLRRHSTLCSASPFQAGHVCILKRSVFIKRATDEVGTIR
jgi:hypothetical protein